ncbi:MAG: folylpolyglutamate synthase/dihydrofolate synthase family protein [Fimbriimonadales bacterium]
MTAVDYIQSLNLYGWRLGNARMEALLQRLGNLHDRVPMVHVTGTNGKGSTTALIASILKHAGYRVGSYFSPYVFDFCERIQMDGVPISYELLEEGVRVCRPHIERLRDTEFGQVTEFELKTALAFWAFATQGMDIAVMEVGLGGRLDATNVIVPEVSVIVSIGLDHTDRLGPTHRDIAYEKAGIIKPGRPVVSGALHPDADAMIAQVAERRGASLLRVQPEGCEGMAPVLRYEPIDSPRDSALRVVYGDWCLHLEPTLLGNYQRHNTACAVGAVLRLRERGYHIPDSAIVQGVANTQLPGRLQVVHQQPTVVLDGAHNPDAAQALAKSLPNLFQYRHLVLVFGMLQPHEPAPVLEPLLRHASEVIFTQIPNMRAYKPEMLQQIANQLSPDTATSVCPDPHSAFETALERAQPDDLVLITGSFYLIGLWRQPGAS